MQFIVIGLDGTDAEAMSRRLAVRADHIALGDELLAKGHLWYGAALLDDSGNMKGSMYLVDFETEADLRKWLDREPYVTGDVWRTVEVHKCNVREPWQFSRPREFFEHRQ